MSRSQPALTHAGAVVFRRRRETREFLVVSSSTGRDWVLPKGHIEPREDAATAALRELEEEAGVCASILAPLAVQHYERGAEQVCIRYYLAECTTPLTQQPADGDTSPEGRIVRWVDRDQALALLGFPDARSALEEAEAQLDCR